METGPPRLEAAEPFAKVHYDLELYATYPIEFYWMLGEGAAGEVMDLLTMRWE